MIPRALTPAAFVERRPGAIIEYLSGETMGTTWSLQAVASRNGLAEGMAKVFDLVIAQMSQWEPHSDISKFNRATPGEWQSLPPEFMHVLRAALEIGKASGGAFDVTIGSIADAWGFGASGRVTDIPDTLHCDRTRHVEIEAAGLRARRSAEAVLDFSGIAKGFAVDLASQWLSGNGVRHFLMEIGGELCGAGIRPDGQPWWVDLEVPPGRELPMNRIALHELAVATSGDYRRHFETGGARYSHSIDPRSGQPISNGVRSVTVIHKSCMMADGWATALTVLGADEAMRVAEENRLSAYLVTDVAEHMTSDWLAMLD